MTVAWGIVAVVVIFAVLSVSRLLRTFVFGFAAAATVLLLVHMQTNPGEATLALGSMGGGLLVARPLRRLLMGGFF